MPRQSKKEAENKAKDTSIEIKPQADSADIEANKTLAALSYIWILCLVPLLGKKDSPFAQFHAKQGLVLFGLELVGSLVFWFPLFGQILALAFLVVSVIGIIKALNGERWEIPYIYDWAKKINL